MTQLQYNLLAIAIVILIGSWLLFKDEILQNASYRAGLRKYMKERDKNPKPALRPLKKLMIIFLIFISSNTYSQVFIELAPGITNGYFSGQLQVGYRVNKMVLSTGYISIPKSDQPAFFNISGGFLIKERVLVTAGYVKTMLSSDNKAENSNAIQGGVQYHFMKYDRGSFYIAGNYTTPNYISMHIGMSLNLCKEDY